LGRTFNSLVHSDGSSAGPHTLRAIRTPFTARGSYPLHFSAEANTSGDPCLLRDLAVLLRPAEEISGQLHFQREFESLGALAREVVDWRRHALLYEVGRHAPAGSCHSWVTTAAQQWISSAEVLSRWIEASSLPPFKRQAEIDSVDELRRQIGALEGFYAQAAGQAPKPDVKVISGHPGVRLESLEELATEANDVVSRETKHWRHLFADARRVRGPQAGGVAAETREQLESFLDRPDVFQVLGTTCPLPRFGSAVAAAQLVMGEVLRDERLLLEWLRRCPVHADYFRHALTVALGLVGFQPDFTDAWSDESNAADLEALIVATVIGVDDPDLRIRIGMEAERRARGAAAALMRKVMPRLEMGDRISVVD
jgi:hypothetical protein